MASLNLALMTQTARQTFQAAGLPQGINVNDHLAYISSVCDAVQRAWSDWASQAMLHRVHDPRKGAARRPGCLQPRRRRRRAGAGAGLLPAGHGAWA